MNSYGTFHLPLWRIWDIKNKSYLYPGKSAGTRKEMLVGLHDWICNNHCNGYNPHEPKPEDMTDAEYAEMQRNFRAARRRFRIVDVKVRIADDYGTFSGNVLSATVI
jgi:hypothetical protein